jgi:hypothetical protein
MLLSQSAALHRAAASCNRPGKPGIKVVKHSSVSTGRLRRLPALHPQPINLVVFQGTSGPEGPTKPHLGDGFALICFQRLSRPHIATLRCLERDNRNTSGASLQILSY